MAKQITIDGNEAVARVAYALSEVIAIYPITPASPMGEYADDWSALGRQNLWGAVPQIVEMQSEAGAAGAIHGALQSGTLATTFTASQGLLLMLPNLFKIAGELSPFCMHVAARSIATHALSIFGDHSDVMAARGTGFALLASGSVQEAQDMAAIGHAVALSARIPVLHFFDGFRTSHEIAKITVLEDKELIGLIDPQRLGELRDRRLTPDRPVIRGTSQNPDTFFQSREAANRLYNGFVDQLENVMRQFEALTGRAYHAFDYHGHHEADRVIVLMGSGAECAHETVDWLLKRGERVGVLKVRLFRPWSTQHFLNALPKSVRQLAVLDRTKEPGSVGEPLLLEISAAFMEAFAGGRLTQMPRVIGGRYGLSSREFTPAMVQSVFQELDKQSPKTRFTVGVRDDVTNLSLEFDESLDIESPDVVRAIFYGLGSDGTVSSNKASIKILGEETELFAQGHFVYDSKKSGSTTVSHLRFGPQSIRSTYQITKADFVAVHDPAFLNRIDAKFASAGKETRKKDLGLLAMSYGHVYVASVAMQARSEQTVRAFQEAESYAGPALIIAHSPCIAHGYDLLHSPIQQRRAIESGAWPLYRFDPRRIAAGEPPLQLDSGHKTSPLRRYMEEEARFRMVQLRDPQRYERLLQASEEAVQQRRSLYLQLAGVRIEPTGHGDQHS